MLSLKLFNAVLFKESDQEPFISEDGFIIEPGALWAKDKILDYYKTNLNGNDLNKTFHKSWAKIKNSSRFDLFVEQMKHYVSTYGSDFKEEVYIPDEIVNLPDVKLSYKLIKAYTKEELIDKCLSLLSGIALKEETINDVLSLLIGYGYEFTGKEVRNKEAIIKIADMFNVVPDDIMEFFRYIIYRATGKSLLIKSNEVIEAIKSSNYNPSLQFNKFGLERLAEIFNRFKPLFLAFKNKCPGTINKISRLSKTHHKPMVTNPLNKVTSVLLKDRDTHWLDNATIYSLFKSISACYTRMNGQDSFVYRIRNGKSWVKETETNKYICKENYNFLIDYLKKRHPLSCRIFLPKNIKYGLPTSEKMFVGNIPVGTRFYGKKLAIGVYWENSWGAYDLDLLSINIYGKVGWNSGYKQKELFYSGDVTSAPNGAVEYLYARNGLDVPSLIINNVYTGDADCGYKIIIGKGDGISRDYMMNPNKLFAEIKCNSVQKQTVLGILTPKKNSQCFVLLNFGAGSAGVTKGSKMIDLAIRALYQQWAKPLSFNKIVKLLGAEIVENDYDYDFRLNSIEKDSFIKLFN